MIVRTFAAAAFGLSLMAGAAFAQVSPPGTAPAGTGRPPAPVGAPTLPSTASPSAPAPATAPSSPATTGQFTTEAAAKAHCPTDTVVWANLAGSKAYHMAGAKYYGKTKKGAYMCQKEADAGGFHPAGRRKSAASKS